MRKLFYIVIACFALFFSTGMVFGQSYDICTRLKNNGHNAIQAGEYVQANDTLRLYIEMCANQNGSFHAFSELDGAVSFMNDVNNRWLEYRNWLKKVLYLNTDTLYYCSDVSSMITTFQYFQPGRGVDNNGEVAIIDFLLDLNRCPENKFSLIDFRNSIRSVQVKIWRDTVGADSIHKPLDTSAVTLESLDLQILRGPQKAVSPDRQSGSAITLFLATNNPFTDATVLRYELADAVPVRLVIYDILGREVFSEGEGMKQAGEHKIAIDGKLFPSGTYYARLSTLSGEVKTVKIVHE
ncbi:MAG: T9SS type A sorting domain-containing protein [bacterium]